MISAPFSTDEVASASALPAALDDALARIPPLWPLKHFVAVNPFVGLANRKFGEACELLQRTVGAAPLQLPADYLAAWKRGEIQRRDLEAAADPEWPSGRLLATLEAADPTVPVNALPTVADLLDAERPRAHWSGFVVEEISKWCAVTFDENQTTWTSPWKSRGLFATWRDAAEHDGNPEAFGLSGFRAFVQGLPAETEAVIAHCLDLFAPPQVALADFLHRQLATVAGWAGYAQYVVREDALRGRKNSTLRELLAIRLAYDAALFHAFAEGRILRSGWSHASAVPQDSSVLAALIRWQFAYENGYQRQLAASLLADRGYGVSSRAAVQAVFCIDVRSEVFRRQLESALPDVQTIGFAGFFGFPVAHRRAGDASSASRCPVLLVPPVDSCEPLANDVEQSLRAARAEAGAWKAFQNSAASCFSFVESAGLVFGAALGRLSGPQGPRCDRVAPDFGPGDTVPLATRVELAEGALRNMSLTRNFARLILICGHGSQSANNPYASALDCGACGGHAGDVNARLAAAILNAPVVRAGLAARGIAIPDDTRFVAGLHNTTTDDITLFDLEALPRRFTADVANLREALAKASAAARRERAPTLKLSTRSDRSLTRELEARASDISQVRPEWGLANNAALIAAPRHRTRGLDLQGRVFLHDYNAAEDPESKVLTLILCAPVVVASWINLQYYASRVDPVHYASGNKVLHNVLGGLGVMEGNGGDLKVGLPLQSIHDGQRFVHEPRRLSVYIEAPPPRIQSVLNGQPAVRQLFDHGWLHLFAIHEGACCRYVDSGWRDCHVAKEGNPQ